MNEFITRTGYTWVVDAVEVAIERANDYAASMRYDPYDC